MECPICKKSNIENEAVKTIWEGEIVNACKTCIIREGIPVIKKATQEQIDASNVHYSVRERMERMTKKPTIVKDQAITHKNLARLSFPQKRQDHESLIPNYDWELKTARRRKKLSINQLALASGLIPEDIQKLENGQLVNNIEQVITRLENTLGIVLLKKNSKMAQARYVKQENEIIDEIIVKSEEETPHEKKERGFFRNIFSKKKEIRDAVEDTEDLLAPEKKDVYNQIASGKLDFSKKENIEKITLNDLAELKKRKEKGEMFGSDELEFDED